MKKNHYLFLTTALVAVVLFLLPKCNKKEPMIVNQGANEIVKKITKDYDAQINVILKKNDSLEKDLVKARKGLIDRKIIYKDRIVNIIDEAPDTCEVFLNKIRSECDTLIEKSDTNLVREKRSHQMTKMALNLCFTKDTVNNMIIKGQNIDIEKLQKNNKKLAERPKKSTVAIIVLTILAMASLFSVAN
jgi:hypothetical protein